MPATTTILLLLPVAALLLLCSLPSVGAANTYTVLIGWETESDANGPSWYSLWFYPPALTIAYGDSVTFVWNSGEVHNVVFSNGTTLSETNPDGSLAPIAGVFGNQTVFSDYGLTYSSGIRNSHGFPLTLQFLPIVGSGTFAYYCSIHSMLGTVTVLPAGQSAPLTPAQVNATTAASIASLEVMANTEIAALSAVGPFTGPGVSHTTLADGSTQWTVAMGAMWMNPIGVAMYARFLPSYLEVHVNDTVQWVTDGYDAHVVFFNASGAFAFLYDNWSPNQTSPVNASLSHVDPAYSLNPQFDAHGVPITTLPTATWPNSAGSLYSGIILGAADAGLAPFPTSFSTKFVSVGSWPYTCPLHYDIGMVAQLVVKPANAPLCTNPANASTCALLVNAVSVKGDPQFRGLLGQSFQVHGLDGAVYAILSTASEQVNARFAFLTGPRPCPKLSRRWLPNGAAEPIACWSHDGSYLSELGIVTAHSRVHIRAGDASSGFALITLDGVEVTDGPAGTDARVTVHGSHHLTVRVGAWTLFVENSDGFVNIAGLEVSAPLRGLDAHGLLGQTSRRVKGDVEGDVDDYTIVDGDLFGHDFLYTRFVAEQ